MKRPTSVGSHLDASAGPDECSSIDMNGHDLGQAPLPNTAGHVRNLKQTLQVAKLQRFAFDAAMSLQRACTKPDTGEVCVDIKTALAVFRLIQGWNTCADRLRILRGRGLPASVRSKPARSVADIQP